MDALSKNVYDSWLLLKVTYTLVPILIGVDKILTWWIVDWAHYTNPMIMEYIPVTLMQFIVITGVIEIIAGIIVWILPRFGGYLIAAWMLLVVINLISMNRFYDIIARDLVIAIGALVLAWLSTAREQMKHNTQEF